MRRKVKTPNFREVKEVVNRPSCETALRDKGAEQTQQVFKDSFHRVQELLVPV